MASLPGFGPPGGRRRCGGSKRSARGQCRHYPGRWPHAGMLWAAREHGEMGFFQALGCLCSRIRPGKRNVRPICLWRERAKFDMGGSCHYCSGRFGHSVWPCALKANKYPPFSRFINVEPFARVISFKNGLKESLLEKGPLRPLEDTHKKCSKPEQFFRIDIKLWALWVMGDLAPLFWLRTFNQIARS